MPSKRDIGKNKKRNKKQGRKNNQNKSYSSPGNGQPGLRFKVGDRVECKMNDGSFQKGQIMQLWWRNPQWPQNQVAPYQVKLDSGMLIFVPYDDPAIVRGNNESKPEMRFGVGHRVLCKVQANPDKWEPGVVIALEFPLPQNPNHSMPYQIRLDEGRIIFAPVDSDAYVKEDPDRVGEEMPEEVINLLKGKNLRFKVGDVVECKIRPMPELWADGTITALNINHPQHNKIKVPYEIRLHSNGGKIYAPADSDDVIRKSTGKTKTYRFKVGQKVQCKMSPTEDIWEDGSIVEVGVQLPSQSSTVPYKILLDSGKQTYAPLDDDSIIRAWTHTEEIMTAPHTHETNLDDDFFDQNNENNPVETLTQQIEEIEIEELD